MGAQRRGRLTELIDREVITPDVAFSAIRHEYFVRYVYALQQEQQ